MSLMSELARRNVLRVAAAYLVFGWLVLQIVAVLAPMLALPDWIGRAVLLLLVLGFIAALVVSWIYELTPQGLQRTDAVPAERSIAPETGRRLDRFVLAGLVVAIALVAADRFWPRDGRVAQSADTASVVTEQAEPPVPAEASIAVLPLANLSGDADQEYFSDGMSEELLNVLAKVPGLRVAARTSSFQFKGRNLDIQDIGRQLNVATVLEGSLRKSGDRVRITAQLIDARSGFHLWSESYDRELADVFAVQDEIAGEIAAKLREHLGLAPASRVAATVTRVANPAAYDAYLRGRELLLKRSRTSIAEGLAALKEAVALDPDYAPAWAQLASAYFLSRRAGSGYGDLPPDEGERLAREALATAQRLDPMLDEVYAIEGVIRQFFLNDLDGALASVDRGIALNPANVQAMHWRADLLPRFGRYRDELEQRLASARLDPLFAINNANIVLNLTRFGRRAEAAPYLERITDRTARPYYVARLSAPDFDGAWDEGAFLCAAGIDVDPDDWGHKVCLASRLAMLELPDTLQLLAEEFADYAEYADTIRGDWAAAVATFAATNRPEDALEFWHFRQAQNQFRAGRGAEALAGFDRVWPNVWRYGVADDPMNFSPRRLWYAQALRDAGRGEEAARVVGINRADVAAARRDGLQAPMVDAMEAEIAAWDGDHETVARLLPRGLMDEPYLSSIEGDPLYAAVRDHAGFKAAVAGERARRAGLRDKFLRAACARPAESKWHPPAASCAGVAATAVADPAPKGTGRRG